MIDIHRIKVELREYLGRRLDEVASVRERLERVLTLFQVARGEGQCWEELLAKVAEAWEGRKPSLLIALPPAEPGVCFDAPESLPAYVSLASDGSHVLPSRHEIPELGLIQLGRVAVGYGTGTPPTLKSRTQLLTPEILESALADPFERPPMEKYVIDERDAAELEELAALSEQQPDDAAAVALLDGSLIRWNLEDRSAAWRGVQLERLREALDRLRRSSCPVVGYISRPGSRDVVHALGIYDYHAKNGKLPSNPAEIMIDSATGEPSDFAAGMTDRALFERLLKPGQRSGWFGSSSHVLQEYGVENRVVFCYLRTDVEVARLEIPVWAQEWSERIHAVVLDQCRKGRGYPITLSEAHEQAVIRGPDRELFYRMAIEEWHRLRLRSGLRTSLPRPSPKQQRKTRPVL